MLNVILARHAETIWNEQLRYIGRTDLALSPLGQKNAALLADFLREQKIDAVFASDMRRAVETATAVADAHSLPVQREPLLNEIDFGLWEGLTHNEIVDAYPEVAKAWSADPFTTPCPQGEPVPVFAARVFEGWSHVTATRTAGSGTILIVTHAGCIKIILGRVLGLDSNKWWRIHQDKGALNYLNIESGTARVLRINDIDYRG